MQAGRARRGPGGREHRKQRCGQRGASRSRRCALGGASPDRLREGATARRACPRYDTTRRRASRGDSTARSDPREDAVEHPEERRPPSRHQHGLLRKLDLSQSRRVEGVGLYPVAEDLGPAQVKHLLTLLVTRQLWGLAMAAAPADIATLRFARRTVTRRRAALSEARWREAERTPILTRSLRYSAWVRRG